MLYLLEGTIGSLDVDGVDEGAEAADERPRIGAEVSVWGQVGGGAKSLRAVNEHTDKGW